jgi:arsenate reductase (glutaredoxin)
VCPMVPGRHAGHGEATAGWRASASLRDVPASPPPDAPVIQVFGLENDPATRAAIRFFKERRTGVSFVDLRKRPIAPGELRRFTDRLGARALLDETSRPYRDAGLGYLSLDDAGIVARLLADHRLLRLPLIRHGHEVTVGRAEPTWAEWVRVAAAP